MHAKELSQALAQRAVDVAEYLLPGGKKKGAEWKAGSVSGEAGDSLGVHLTGHKAGVWRDFNADVGGDLLDLWRAVRGCSLADAIREAKTYLGIHDVELRQTPKEWKRPPQKAPEVKPESAALRWLKGERGITDAAIAAYRVGVSKDGRAVVFPHYRGAEMVNFKLRDHADKKRMMTFGGGEPCLWGWQAIAEDARSIVIAEGEIDAMTLWQCGIPALSVFSGVSNLGWIESDHDRLERFSDIVLCMDMDDAGQGAARKIAERLGLDRCRIASLPKKDANECLLAGMHEAIREAIEQARHVAPDELRNAADFEDLVIECFYPTDDRPIGLMFPWIKAAGKLAIRPSELSIWTGINGHGKSQMLGQVVLHAMMQGERACIASMELRPERMLHRLVRQMTAAREPSIRDIKACMTWLRDRAWVFNVVGSASTTRILEVFAYARKRYGVTQFVIDSLMKCMREEDDYNAQKAFVDRLCDFKQQHDCHVHLVAHSRKKMNEDGAPGKMDIKGSGSIGDLADNLYSVWRNKKKEAGEETPVVYDAILNCDKQRHGEWEGALGFYFDRDSFQYLDDANELPRRIDVLVHQQADTRTEGTDEYVAF